MITLHRLTETSDGTFGHIVDSKGYPTNILTMELPYKMNLPRVSCIPKGDYHLQSVVSPTRGPVWQLMNVPDRDKIYIHVANVIDEISGCIGAGLAFGVVSSAKKKVTRFGIQNSKSATSQLYSLIMKDADKVIRII